MFDIGGYVYLYRFLSGSSDYAGRAGNPPSDSEYTSDHFPFGFQAQQTIISLLKYQRSPSINYCAILKPSTLHANLSCRPTT
jgi:hypothetical protein